jgi:ABC-type cobalamin transport system ATPase subunit
MLDSVLREVAARGRTVVMTSHDLARAADLADRIDVLSRGKIAASAKRAELPEDQLLQFYRQAISAASTASLPHQPRMGAQG